MTEQTTALAQQAPPKEWALTRDTLAETELCKSIAKERGLDALTLLAAIQRGIKCDATTADVLIFVAQAKKYDLDFIGNPPEIQLLNFGNGPQPYARVDAYKKYIRRARESGELRWAHYADEWRDDPRCAPGRVNDKGEKLPDAAKQRCGVVRFQLRNDPEPGERIAWLYEWNMPKNPNWVSRTSQMLLHRTWKEFCRDYLGYTIADEDDGERSRPNEPRRVEAEVRDSERADPIVAIPSLRRPGAAGFAPPPPSLEEPQAEPSVPPVGSPSVAEDVVALTGGGTSEPDASPVAKPATPRGSLFPEPEPFDREASAKLDAEFAKEDER